MSEYLPATNTVLVIVNLAIVIGGVYLAVKHFQLTRTWMYIERFNNPEFFEIKVGVEIFIAELRVLDADEARERVEQLMDSRDPEEIRLRTKVATFLNLFTELGVAYRARAVSHKAVLTFDRLVPHYWNCLEPYIRVAQERAKPHTVYTSFEYLLEKLRKKGISK